MAEEYQLSAAEQDSRSSTASAEGIRMAVGFPWLWTTIQPGSSMSSGHDVHSCTQIIPDPATGRSTPGSSCRAVTEYLHAFQEITR